MITFDQFIQDKTGQVLLYPPNPKKFLGECYQNFNFYNRDVVGAPDYLAPLAHMIFTNFEKSPLAPFYDKIEYTSGATPQKGDVVVWSKDLPGSGEAGHVAPCTRPGVIIFESFDSNWGGKQAHLVEHDFSYVLGWLRPKKGRVMDENDAKQLYSIAMHRQPESDAAWQHWVGKKFSDFADKQFIPGSEWHRQNHVLKVAYPETVKALELSENEVRRLRALAGEESSAAQLKAALLAFLGLNK